MAALAGNYLKKVVLELGGSDPFVVLEDADLAAAARLACESRLTNSGQVCNNSKRFIIQQPVHQQFVQLLIQEIQN